MHGALEPLALARLVSRLQVSARISSVGDTTTLSGLHALQVHVLFLQALRIRSVVQVLDQRHRAVVALVGVTEEVGVVGHGGHLIRLSHDRWSSVAPLSLSASDNLRLERHLSLHRLRPVHLSLLLHFFFLSAGFNESHRDDDWVHVVVLVALSSDERQLLLDSSLVLVAGLWVVAEHFVGGLFFV